MSKQTDAYRRWEDMYNKMNERLERQKAALTRLTRACFECVTMLHELAVDEDVPLKYRMKCRRTLDTVASFGVPIPSVDGEEVEDDGAGSGNPAN